MTGKHSHIISEGLRTALHVFDDIKEKRTNDRLTHSHIISEGLRTALHVFDDIKEKRTNDR